MSCGICDDRKVVPKSDGTTRPCVCAIQDKIKDNLLEFADANINRKIAYEKLHRNILLRNSELPRFRDMAKTYLTLRMLRTMNFELEFVNTMGSDITEASFNNHDEYTTSLFKDIDILFLRLGKDYLHKTTRAQVPYILQVRTERPNLITWVYVYPGTTDSELQELYGEQILDILKKSFSAVK